MAEPKTRPTGASVPAFLARITSPERRADCKQLNKLMREISGAPAKMWGPSIVGFGRYLMRYANGRELDWPLLGYSPRKQYLAVYIMCGLAGRDVLVAKLGKHKGTDGCLTFQRLADVNKAVLTTLLERSVAATRQKHPE